MGVGVGQREVVRHTAAAMGLNGPVDDLAGHIGGDNLDHGDFGFGDLVAYRVHHVGGFQR